MLEANAPFLKILGRKDFSEISGDKITDWMEEKAKRGFVQALLRCQQQGFVSDYECVCQRDDGSKIYLLINAHLNQAPAGETISATCKDITAIKRVEWALRDKEARLRAVLNISPAAIYILTLGDGPNCPLCASDPQCKMHLSFISASIQDITGFSERDYMSDCSLWLERVHPDDVKSLKEGYRHLSSETGLDNQYRFRHKNGEYRWLNEKLIVQRDEQGEICQVIGSMMDVSDIVHTQQQVLKLSSAVEQSPCPIFITNTRGIIEYVNSKLTELTGYDEGEVLGRTPKLFSSGRTEVSLYRDLWSKITQGKKWYGTIRNKKKDGQYFWVKEAIAPIRNSGGQITHFVAIQEDVSKMIDASKELERQLKEHTQKIKLLEQQRSEQRKSVAIGRMAAWVAHEINNPLAGIKNSFQLLKSAIPDDHQYFRYVGLIDKEIDRISLITKQLYSMYKQEDTQAHEFDCNIVIEEIVLLCNSGQKRSTFAMFRR
nr:PAS domain S-box protein [Methylomarinum sp. Ch1-1]MDP4521869.1 PAS domain S-box protein [Methylomarinum sp. Ch1-1]